MVKKRSSLRVTVPTKNNKNKNVETDSEDTTSKSEKVKKNDALKKRIEHLESIVIKLEKVIDNITEKELEKPKEKLPMKSIKRACRSWLTTRLRSRHKDPEDSLEAEMWINLNNWLKKYPIADESDDET